MTYKPKKKPQVSNDDKIKKGNQLFEKYCEELAQKITELLKESKSNPDVLNHISNILLNASEVNNPDTGTVYSVRNAMMFSNYSNMLAQTKGINVLPHMVTLNAAKKAIAEAKVNGIDAELDFGYTQGLAPIIKNIPIKDKDNKLKNSEDKDRLKFLKYCAGFKPTPALVNVNQITPSEAIPESWRLKNKGEVHFEDQKIRDLINFMISDVIKTPVKRVITNTSSMNENYIYLGNEGCYRSVAAELNTIYHEFSHMTGVRDVVTGDLLSEEKVRESFSRYSENDTWRAQEEVTVQIATNHFLASLYKGTIPKELYKEILENGERYIVGWTTATSFADEKSLAEGLGVCISNAEKASSAITRTMVRALEANPKYAKQFVDDFGKTNFVAKTYLDNKINNEPKCENKAKPQSKNPKLN